MGNLRRILRFLTGLFFRFQWWLKGRILLWVAEHPTGSFSVVLDTMFQRFEYRFENETHLLNEISNALHADIKRELQTITLFLMVDPEGQNEHDREYKHGEPVINWCRMLEQNLPIVTAMQTPVFYWKFLESIKANHEMVMVAGMNRLYVFTHFFFQQDSIWEHLSYPVSETTRFLHLSFPKQIQDYIKKERLVETYAQMPVDNVVIEPFMHPNWQKWVQHTAFILPELKFTDEKPDFVVREQNRELKTGGLTSLVVAFAVVLITSMHLMLLSSDLQHLEDWRLDSSSLIANYQRDRDQQQTGSTISIKGGEAGILFNYLLALQIQPDEHLVLSQIEGTSQTPQSMTIRGFARSEQAVAQFTDRLLKKEQVQSAVVRDISPMDRNQEQNRAYTRMSLGFTIILTFQ